MSEYDELKSRIEKVEARIEIEELIVNYGKAADHPDLEKGHKLFVSLFSDDCIYTNPKFGITLEGNGDNPPVFDENDPKKLIQPGGIGWMFKNFIHPNQDDYVSLIGSITINVDGDTATGGDHMIRSGYKKPKPAEPSREDLEFTHAVHKFKFAKIENKWKIVWFEGNPVHTTSGIKKQR